jgi:hypothetical protein
MDDRIEVGLPDKLEINRRGSEIEIVRTWFGPQVLFMTVFAVFWDGFLYFWYSKLGELKGGMDSMAFYFPMIHVAVGAGITYYVLCGWLNRTRITVGRSKVSVRHGPLPWFGNLEMDATAIKQLFAKEIISSSRSGNTVRYDLNALTRDGRNIKFISGIENSDQALYIEQEIEKFLGIKDGLVKGEYIG